MNLFTILLGLFGLGPLLNRSNENAAWQSSDDDDTPSANPFEPATEDNAGGPDDKNTPPASPFEPVNGGNMDPVEDTADVSDDNDTPSADPYEPANGGDTTDPVEDDTEVTVSNDTPPADPYEPANGGDTTDPVEDDTEVTVSNDTPPADPYEPANGGDTTDPVEDDDTEVTVSNDDNSSSDDSAGSWQPSGDVGTPVAPEQTGGLNSDGGETAAQDLSGTVTIMEGRVATLAPTVDDIAGIRIVSNVEHGNVTVNPDNTIAAVMTQSDFTGQQNFQYEVTHSDGSTSMHTGRLNVTEGAQADGWGTGELHYMLATDENDKVVVEHGEDHTKVFVSGSNEALSLREIAQMENMSLSQVTGSWLAGSKYGQSEEFALDSEAGMELWQAVTPRGSETSNWLLFERGYEYDNLGRILDRDTNGESEMNPLYMGAWGTGEPPEIKTELYQYQESTDNLVVQDLHFSGRVFITHANNMIFDNVLFTEDQVSFQASAGITVRNSEFLDIVRSESRDGDGTIDAHSDRIQGIFMNRTDGVLLEGNLFDYIAWEEGYENDPSIMDPSMWSHNIYLGDVMTDVTLRDTISMRAASFGAQVRSGGFIEDNLFIDNNAGLTFVGGDYKGSGPVGQYTLATDNLITSAAHKEATYIGAKALGVKDEGVLTSMVDNIIAHLADPNSDELDYKYDTRYSLYSPKETYYDDTIIHNWEGSRNVHNPEIITEANTDGLNTEALDQTTIQQFAAQLLNKPDASIEDFANYLRAQASNNSLDDVVDADLILRFFQEGFGIESDIRDGAETLRFVPNDLAEGVRWDNRLNWDTEDLPGLYAADSADLGGNHVVFGTNARIDELDLGPDGELTLYGGRLTLEGGLVGDDSGEITLEGAGQLWTDGSTADDLTINVDGGRFVNTGDFSGADLTAKGGETVLATDGATFEVSESKTLAIFEAAKVGFDGDDNGLAILDMEEGSTLAFSAENGGLGTIEEFRTGTMGDTPDVRSGIDLGNSTLSIDLSGLSGGAGSFKLMDADEIVGVFDDALLDGLGARNAKVFIDYEADTVTLELSEGGNGAVSVETIGEETDVSSGEGALWAALTAGQGVVSETQAAMVDEEEEDLLDTAA